MAIHTTTIERIVFIRWNTNPQLPDVAVFDEAMSQARKELGKPIFHVSIMPEGVQLPPLAVQQALIKRVMRMRATCQSMHAVLEGRGLAARIGRRFMSGLAKTMGMGGQAYVHATVEEAIKEICAKQSLDPANVSGALSSSGLLTKPL